MVKCFNTMSPSSPRFPKTFSGIKKHQIDLLTTPCLYLLQAHRMKCFWCWKWNKFGRKAFHSTRGAISPRYTPCCKGLQSIILRLLLKHGEMLQHTVSLYNCPVRFLNCVYLFWAHQMKCFCYWNREGKLSIKHAVQYLHVALHVVNPCIILRLLLKHGEMFQHYVSLFS